MRPSRFTEEQIIGMPLSMSMSVFECFFQEFADLPPQRSRGRFRRSMP